MFRVLVMYNFGVLAKVASNPDSRNKHCAAVLTVWRAQNSYKSTSAACRLFGQRLGCTGLWAATEGKLRQMQYTHTNAAAILSRNNDAS